MTQNASFIRKVIYITAIAVLLLPLASISQPATATADGLSRGGLLASMRQKYNLSQALLGEIDPASESMRLALFGLQGVAANILWDRAHEYKKKKNWAALDATVKQIVRLQPNFKKVWDFQAHNLSYNVSVEFDNYEHRYLWVKKGIDFLITGTHYNTDDPLLLWDLGWYTGQKLGRSDEKKQFRRLYRLDREFHKSFRDNGINVEEALGADGKPDNWYTARLWYMKGQRSADDRGRPIRGKSPLIYHNQPAMAQINGSDAMEKDGFLGERAQSEWRKAEEEYRKFGARPIPTSYGHPVRLNDMESIRERAVAIRKELDTLAPGAREELLKENLDKLTPAERAVYDKKPADRTIEETRTMYEVQGKLAVTDAAVAAKAPADKRAEAWRKADQIATEDTVANHTERYRDIINFAYWRSRCQAEQLDDAIAAHKHLFDAETAYRKTDLAAAKTEYETAFTHWAKVYAQHPLLMDNAEAQDVVDSVKKYNDILGQLDEEFPAEFPLNSLLDLHDEGRKIRAMQRKSKAPTEAKSEESKPEEAKPDEKKEPEGKDSEKNAPGDEKPTDAKPETEGDAKPAESK